MNIAIIGSSGHYPYALEALRLRGDLSLSAIAPGSPREDITPLADAVRDRGLAPRAYGDYRTLLDSEQIDLAVVNPWFCDAASVSVECLRRGLHVFSEKPLATDLKQLDELTRAWEASGCALGAMFNLRYCAWFKTVRKAVDDGLIGEVRQLHGQKSYKLGVRPEVYLNRETFGGIIPWVAIHAVDWVLQLGGRCEWVAGVQSNRRNRGQGDLEITSALMMQMENGVIGTVTADFLRPDGAPRHDDDRLRVTGTEGMLEALNGQVFIEDAHSRRELPLETGKNCLLVMLDALGTPDSRRQALDAIEATRVSLLAREAGDARCVMRNR